ncbi:hypothetical protein BaRGS_00003941, partial [Batillaria attramentaria]
GTSQPESPPLPTSPREHHAGLPFGSASSLASISERILPACLILCQRTDLTSVGTGFSLVEITSPEFSPPLTRQVVDTYTETDRTARLQENRARPSRPPSGVRNWTRPLRPEATPSCHGRAVRKSGSRPSANGNARGLLAAQIRVYTVKRAAWGSETARRYCNGILSVPSHRVRFGLLKTRRFETEHQKLSVVYVCSRCYRSVLTTTPADKFLRNNITEVNKMK